MNRVREVLIHDLISSLIIGIVPDAECTRSPLQGQPSTLLLYGPRRTVLHSVATLHSTNQLGRSAMVYGAAELSPDFSSSHCAPTVVHNHIKHPDRTEHTATHSQTIHGSPYLPQCQHGASTWHPTISSSLSGSASLSSPSASSVPSSCLPRRHRRRRCRSRPRGGAADSCDRRRLEVRLQARTQLR